MWKYIVHAERENIRNFTFITEDRGHEYHAANVPSQRQKECDYVDIVGMETWYFNEYKWAEQFALTLSKKAPTRLVYIAKVEALVQTPPGKTTVSAVSEKGVLPK